MRRGSGSEATNPLFQFESPLYCSCTRTYQSSIVKCALIEPGLDLLMREQVRMRLLMRLWLWRRLRTCSCTCVCIATPRSIIGCARASRGAPGEARVERALLADAAALAAQRLVRHWRRHTGKERSSYSYSYLYLYEYIVYCTSILVYSRNIRRLALSVCIYVV